MEDTMPSIQDTLTRAYEFLRAGSFPQAEQVCRQILQVDSANAQAWFWLGVACQGQGKLAEAAAHYRQAIALRPEFAEAHSNLGGVLAMQRMLEGAVASLRRAVQIRPDFPEALNGLGTALHALAQLPEAEVHLRQALQLRPDFADAHYNLGNTLYSRGLPDAAEEQFREALRLRPSDAKAQANLGSVLKDQGRLEETLAAYRQALMLRPDNARVHSNLLYALLHDSRATPEMVFAEHRRWAEIHAEPLAVASGSPLRGLTPPARPGRLRIGYVSPDLHRHVVASFLEPILATHDHERFEITCYANVARPDAVTRRLQRYADRWRWLVSLTDEEAVQLIREEGIDILVDLAGHTANNRLLVLARKPAPAQVTYLGHPATTGMRAIDYRLTDAWADPPGMTEHLHSERLVRLPGSALIFQAGESPEMTRWEPGTQGTGGGMEDPSSGDAPAWVSGEVTFGSFNKLAKLNAEVFALWSRILAALPRARLVVKVGATERGKERLLLALDQAGIDRERVTCLGRSPTQLDYLGMYRGVDICLDPFPFNGVTTTCDALWMGVPVVSLAGRTSVSRQGVSILSQLGLTEWVAESPDAYVAIAVRLGDEVEELRKLRASLAERMRVGHRQHAQAFTRNLEAAHRRIWGESI
jgi:predicted O-linked N-acetylglucosamine transferase (SPINDLY family)